MNITVTRLDRKDYDNLQDILQKQQQFHYELNKDKKFLKIGIAEFRDYMLCTHDLVLVAEDEDALDKGYIGFIAVSGRTTKESLRIQDLYVDEEYRSKLVGTLLMQNMLQWSKEIGFNRLKVHVTKGNERVFDFYKRFGFRLLTPYDKGYELGKGFGESIGKELLV